MDLGKADRRKIRYARLKKAIDAGLVPADELKMKDKVDSQAVDPALGDELAARLLTPTSVSIPLAGIGLGARSALAQQ
jgi:hypothetical protein